MHLIRNAAVMLASLTLLAAPAMAQATGTPPKLDLGVTYTALRSLKANTDQNFWLQGGSLELGVNLKYGFGIAANLTGVHAGSIGTSGIPLSFLTVTAGPRYRWHARRRLSIYGEGLVGEGNAFNSLFPGVSGTQDDANALALQVGGGVDYAVTRRFCVRALDAAWVRTQFPNGGDNVQNNLRLGAGVVMRFGR